MNALGWDLVHSDRFEATTEAYCDQIEAQLVTGPSDAEVERITQELEQLREFVSAANRLRNGEIDPVSLPRLCSADGTPISKFYVLKVGPWHGYYLLDPVARVGKGMFAFNENIHDLEVRVRAAVEEAQKGA
jgi:hypothetical protein